MLCDFTSIGPQQKVAHDESPKLSQLKTNQHAMRCPFFSGVHRPPPPCSPHRYEVAVAYGSLCGQSRTLGQRWYPSLPDLGVFKESIFHVLKYIQHCF